MLNSGRMCSTDLLCVTDELIEAGCDVNHADVSGRRLLNYLVKGGVQSEAAVRRLLIEGADHDMVRYLYLSWCTSRGTYAVKKSPRFTSIHNYCRAIREQSDMPLMRGLYS